MKGSLKFLGLFVIARELLTMVNLMTHDHLADDQERLDMYYHKPNITPYYIACAILIILAIYLLRSTEQKIVLILFSVAFGIELAYQSTVQFFEVFPGITTPVIIIAIVVAFIQGMKIEKTNTPTKEL